MATKIPKMALSLQLEKPIHDAVREAARRHDRSVSGELRHAVRKYVEELDGRQAVTTRK